MTGELQLVKSDVFGGIEYDIYSDNKEMYMTAEQLGKCLSFSNGRKGIDNIVARNEYLNNPEFSVTLKLRATDGKYYNTRVFKEDGIYEVTMLARTEIAQEFRARVRKVLKGVRQGELTNDKAKSAAMKDFHETLRLRNREREIELKAQNETARLNERKRANEEREKQKQIEALLALTKDNRLMGKARAEVMAKIYELSAGESFSSAALNELFSIAPDEEQAAYERLCIMIRENRSKFDQDCEWGKLTDNEVCIIKSQFDDMCGDLDISPKPLLKWLSEKKLIKRDSNGQSTVPTYIGSKTTRCVVLKMNFSENE